MALTPAGKRDRLVSFQMPVEAEESRGGKRITGWTLAQRAWASVRFGTSQERREAAGTQASQAVTVRVLSTVKLRTVTVRGRIVIDGVNHSIIGIATVQGPGGEIEFTAMADRG